MLVAMVDRAGLIRYAKNAAKNTAKKTIHRSGVLRAYHRYRNRDALTVLVFHRVLARSDPRWPLSNPEWTLSRSLFSKCIDFAKDHYNIINLQQLLDAERRQASLPPWPAMITFDDGWSCNAEYALEVLTEKQVDATIFVVSDAVGKPEPFWEESLFGGWRAKRLTPELCDRLWAAAGGAGRPPASWDTEPSVHALIGRLTALDAEARQPILDLLPDDFLPISRPHMLSVAQLHQLVAAGIEIGSHGRSHEPFDRVPDLTDELTGSRKKLTSLLGNGSEHKGPSAISFPHGRYPDQALTLARATGYEVLFTCHEVINTARAGHYSWILGRRKVTLPNVADSSGQFRPDLLGLHLFRGKHDYVDENAPCER